MISFSPRGRSAETLLYQKPRTINASVRNTRPMREEARLLAPAKVNLYLRILGRRTDGYHLLDSLMVPISLFDELVVRVERLERTRRGSGSPRTPKPPRRSREPRLSSCRPVLTTWGVPPPSTSTSASTSRWAVDSEAAAAMPRRAPALNRLLGHRSTPPNWRDWQPARCRCPFFVHGRRAGSRHWRTGLAGHAAGAAPAGRLLGSVLPGDQTGLRARGAFIDKLRRGQ